MHRTTIKYFLLESVSFVLLQTLARLFAFLRFGDTKTRIIKNKQNLILKLTSISPNYRIHPLVVWSTADFNMVERTKKIIRKRQ